MAASTKSLVKARLEFLARVLLGGLFIVSGASKLVSPGAAANLMVQVLSLSSILAFCVALTLSAVELAIGGLLIMKRDMWIAPFLASCILLGGTLVGVLSLGDPIPCGCFGDLLESRTDEFFIMRNIILLFLSFFVLRESALRITNEDKMSEHHAISI